MLLRMQGVTLRRGGRILLEDFDLDLRPGEALHLSGPNGAGKSSLIRLAAGLLRAERGTVFGARAALADDALALDGELPLQRALAFWSAGFERGLEAMGLADLRAIPVRMLSSGQARRAALARVIASQAPLWLLDEPYNALDAASAERLDHAIERHLASGGGLLAASHLAPGGTWRRLELGA